MNLSFNPWTRMVSPCGDCVRVLELHHVKDDTYAIIEDGEVSLSDSETLKLLLKQLSGKEQL